MIVIERSSEPASSELRALVHDAGLPLDGLGDVPTTMVLARDGQQLVGVAALERHSTYGLLRSVVVAEDRRGQGVGSRLVDEAESLAHDESLEGPYLLTETAAAFFADRGYDVIARDAAPAPIAASIEWSTVCGESAVPMVLRRPASESSAEVLDLGGEA